MHERKHPGRHSQLYPSRGGGAAINKAPHSIFKPKSWKDLCLPPQTLYLTGTQKHGDKWVLSFKDHFENLINLTHMQTHTFLLLS